MRALTACVLAAAIMTTACTQPPVPQDSIDPEPAVLPEPEPKADIPEPVKEPEKPKFPSGPEDRSHLPPPLDGVEMVRVVDGRLNVAVCGWGGLRLIQAKTDPDLFRKYLRSMKDMGLNCVRPLFHGPHAANDNDSKWAPWDWEAMDRCVAITQEERMYLLVDYQNWLVNDTLYTHEAEWLDLWGQIAARYAPYKHLMFEGFNEPQEWRPELPAIYQRWMDLMRERGAEQLLVVSPFEKPFFALKDPASNWAQKRSFYFTPQNSPNAERARKEAELQLAKAQECVEEFGCGYFVAQFGVEGTGDMEARSAGVQRAIDICLERGYGCCLWAYGEWADGHALYGKRLAFSAKYPLITGEIHVP